MFLRAGKFMYLFKLNKREKNSISSLLANKTKLC